MLQIVVEHTRAAVLASHYADKARVAETKEEVEFFIAKKELCKQRIEELRTERIKLIGK